MLVNLQIRDECSEAVKFSRGFNKRGVYLQYAEILHDEDKNSRKMRDHTKDRTSSQIDQDGQDTNCGRIILALVFYARQL